MANTPAPLPGRRRKPLSMWMKLFWGVLTTAAVVLFSVVFVWMFGSVYGTEICAETLERRTFFYLEIPFVQVQVRGVSRIDISGELEKHLVKTNLVSSPPANKKTWHAVHSGRGIFGLKTRDPMILVRYLDARNASRDLAWLSWTQANPKAAAVVWKGVTDLAIAGKYTSIPDVLEAAEGITDKDVAQTKTAVAKIVEKVAKPQPDTRPADAGVEKPDAEEAVEESEPEPKNSGKN
jgi:hypothetical protein